MATTGTYATTPPWVASTYPPTRICCFYGGPANRDPAHFETPGEFRLDRAEGEGHITFGKGPHFCVGAALARLEAQIVLRLLLDRTSEIEAIDVGEWLPSILVRRLERLELAVS